MFPISSYIKFLLGSTNHHGVHSPFIYHYLVDCLYRKPARNKDKTMDVLLKSIPYFGVKTVFLPASASGVRDLLAKACPGLRYGSPPYDLLYFPEPESGNFPGTSQHLPGFHNNSLCIIDRLHTTKRATHEWEKIKSLEQVRVTIDAFYCGLVFFRKEQAGQHFKIRI